uniref:Polyprotein n=1 Tax=Cajanus cajan TaxID=3821 RepID=A0A151RNN5_CAJCA|nr:polyprotein [Cajanus cajan]
MSDIINPYAQFALVYIDDVLMFSNSMEQHIKYLNIFKNVIKKNGMVISKKKIKITKKNLSKQIIRFHWGVWVESRLKYKFLLRINCKSTKEVLEKDVKNIVSKQIFVRWQSLLSCFNFEI